MLELQLNEIETYKVILVICSVGMIISTLEFFYIWRSFGREGAYSWAVFSTLVPMTRNTTLKKLIDAVFGRVRGALLLFSIRMLALVFVIFTPIYSVTFRVSLTVLILSILLLGWRKSLFGDDGSDQMNMVILVTIWLCTALIESSLLLKVGLWFIALQSVLSYCTSGVAKLISEKWRSGEALWRVLSTKAYGIDWIGKFLQSRPLLNYLLSWSTMLIETGFFLVLLLPFPYATMFLVWGVAFHLSNGIIMGLNTFLWAFLSTYPAIIYVWWAIHTHF
jgi:hypothetical protein